MDLTSFIREKAESLLPKVTGIRRDLHKHPETAFEEYRTARVVAECLRSLGLEVQTGVARTGVVGLLRADRPGRTLAIRADMDALAIDEEGDLPFKSENPGAAHACGHDGHMASALGVAEILAELREHLAGAVKFIFQPSEEVFPPGGASEMIKEGVLENPAVDGIVALHVDPSVPLGKISVKRGVMTGTSDEFQIEIIGRGGHGSRPHKSVDPITILCQVVVALQTVVSRNVDPVEPAVVSFGSIHGGQVFNAIPETAALSGTVRTASEDVRALVRQRMEAIVKGVAQAMGAQYEFNYAHNCGATVNNERMVDLLVCSAGKVIGSDNVVVNDRIEMGTEDFGLFAERVPGVYFWLGTRSSDPELSLPPHHPRFNFDESALVIGMKVTAQFAVDFLLSADPLGL